MKNSKIPALFALLFLAVCAAQEDCESIPVAIKAAQTCAPNQQGDKKALFDDKCMAACLSAEWGYLDDDMQLSLNQVNGVFEENIKDENLKKQLAGIHEKCVKEALETTERCKQNQAYAECLGKEKDLKEIVDTKFCKETADAYMVPWE